jgi:hypothetical protein
MDQSLLKDLAQFKLLLKRATQQSADIERLISDPAYGKQVLGLAEESDNEQLVMLALELKDRLGLLPQVGNKGAAVKAETPAEPTDTKKYVGNLRG